ncbi:MAG TPA: hypothetical protein VG028_21440 [Terriglobia bacterium]|nr:hypothetical protein [Terriglobia bacterium]
MHASSQGESLAERAEKAAFAPRQRVEHFIRERAKEVLLAFARNPNLQEPDLLRLLERKDLPPEVLREVASHKETARSYSVKLALTRHPRTPRLVSLPILKFLHLFDLVRVCQTPAVPTDVKHAAEETILKKAERIPRGQKISLARRGSGHVAAGLLFTNDRELIRAILDNPYLTEAHVTRLLSRGDLPAEGVEMIAATEKWSRRYDVRLGLIRNPHTPFGRLLGFLPDLAVSDLKELCLDRRMPEHLRKYIAAHCLLRIKKSRRGNASTE